MPVGPAPSPSIVKRRRVPTGVWTPSSASATSSAVVFEPTSMQAQRRMTKSCLLVLEDRALALLGAALQATLDEAADRGDEREEDDEVQAEEGDDLVVDLPVPA